MKTLFNHNSSVIELRESLTVDSLMGAYVTSNADPYTIEDDDDAGDLLNAIRKNGIREITWGEDREQKLAQLGLPANSSLRVFAINGTPAEYIFAMEELYYTFDVVFHTPEMAFGKGFKSPLQDCMDYIEMYNDGRGAEECFKEFHGGIVMVQCNELEIDVFETQVK